MSRNFLQELGFAQLLPTILFEDNMSCIAIIMKAGNNNRSKHIHLRYNMIKELVAKGVPYLIFVVPLLVESGSWQGLIDYLVVVDCPEELQITRVMQRSKLARGEVEGILRAQASRKDRLACADIVIENPGSLAELDVAVNQLHQKILQIKKEQLSSS